VNKSLKQLLEAGITPDFVVCADAKFVEKTIKDAGSKLADINCIMNINSDSTILAHKFKKVFVSFPTNDMVINKLSQYNSFEQQETGGSATTMAFVAAVKNDVPVFPIAITFKRKKKKNGKYKYKLFYNLCEPIYIDHTLETEKEKSEKLLRQTFEVMDKTIKEFYQNNDCGFDDEKEQEA
jgi:hypothetical protein